ncbi:reverse transcriptase domain-containing protein, partial [Tanacetum coccineum]
MNMLTNLTMQKQNPSGSGSLPSNTIANPRGDVTAITTRSGVAYDGPTVPPTPSPLPKEVKHETEATKDKVHTTSSQSTAHVQPLVVQVPILEPEVAPKPNPKLSIPYPSRLNDQKLREKANNQMLNLLSNKEKLFELANTPLNENCSAVLLKKLPEKLGDPDRFLIPCDFPELVECLALADLGASINLMPLSVWKKLLLPELTPTRMTLEHANRSFAYPIGVAEDVFVKVGMFHFLADFVVVDYDVDPQVPLILRRPFLRTARALIDVHGEELILRDGDKQLIFHTDTTSKYPNEHRIKSVKIINFIDVSCEDNFEEDNFEEVLKIKKLSHHLNGSTTSTPDYSPSLTPIKTKGDIHLLEKLLNNDSSSRLPPKELNFEELKTIKSSIDYFPPLDVLGGNSVISLNPLSISNEDFTSSDDESPPKVDVSKENFKIYSNPLFEFDEEYISSNVNPLFNKVLEDIESEESYVSYLDEPDLLITPLSDANEDECFDPGGDIDEIVVSTDIEDDYHDSEGDIIYLENLLNNDTIP